MESKGEKKQLLRCKECHEFEKKIQDVKNTILMLAISTGHAHSVKRAIREGANKNTLNTSLEKTVDLIKQCASHFSLNLDRKYMLKRTILFFAAERGIYESVNQLIKEGADVNLSRPLIAAVSRCNEDCANLLIKAGSDVNAKFRGDTAFIIAAWEGLDSTIKCLIDAGADLNTRGENGRTALIQALEEKSCYHDNCVQHLIKAGADVNILNECKETALILAVKHGRLHHVDAIIKAGADVNYQGRTLLKYVVEQGASATLQMLFREGLEINSSRPSILTYYLKKFKGKEKREIVLILAAAGEKIDATSRVQIPLYLMPERMPHLKHLCREAIREHLLKLDPHAHLFGRVPRLGLPSLMTDYLLYNVSLNETLED